MKLNRDTLRVGMLIKSHYDNESYLVTKLNKIYFDTVNFTGGNKGKPDWDFYTCLDDYIYLGMDDTSFYEDILLID